MIYLLLSVLCSVTIGNLLQSFRRDRGVAILSIFLGNYVLAAVFSAVMAIWHHETFTVFDVWFGALCGGFFLANFFVYQHNIQINGLSLSVGTMRVGVIIPAVVTLLWFPEALQLTKILGFVIIVAAFVIGTDRHHLGNLLWLLMLFLVSGMTETTMKVYKELGSGQQYSFFTILFTAAAFYTMVSMAIKRDKLQWNWFLRGTVLGVPNQLSSVFFLHGLGIVPATVAFPLVASGIVFFSFISDAIIWKHSYSLAQKVMILLILVGIVLLNI
ncbi:MAG: hypothetical protein CVU48_07810 [Candidatus Cloacimonetes bacterium HGW-Cloacimonetes-1]|jgi:drug/metabolite transporter (DMT)-like permease|nr:MAG: hypothetical protein CVU48_07810 [Candidatus Cloacimonetes bacterium HGW-Cloacimonetes-1]